MIAAVELPAAAAVTVRDARPDDRAAISEILLTSGIFGQTDADCVDEMFCEAPRADGYHWLAAEAATGAGKGGVAGFACYGREWGTHGTWDLFWICVRPGARGSGTGRALIDTVIDRVRAEGGRMVVIYTSSTEPYAAARRLYKAAGCTPAATIPDYYADGDSLLIFTRALRAET